MKKLLVIFLLVLSLGLSSMALHKYYVAVFQVEYVQSKKEFQITSRIFIDDLEKELNRKYNKKFYLGTERELPATEVYLQKYFNEKLRFVINNKSPDLKFLGKEIEDDVLICYITVAAEGNVKALTVKNTTLFESFPDQQNYVHIKINSNKKSLLLTNDDNTGTLEF